MPYAARFIPPTGRAEPRKMTKLQKKELKKTKAKEKAIWVNAHLNMVKKKAYEPQRIKEEQQRKKEELKKREAKETYSEGAQI
jgi:hypothetical protein